MRASTSMRLMELAARGINFAACLINLAAQCLPLFRSQSSRPSWRIGRDTELIAFQSGRPRKYGPIRCNPAAAVPLALKLLPACRSLPFNESLLALDAHFLTPNLCPYRVGVCAPQARRPKEGYTDCYQGLSHEDI